MKKLFISLFVAIGLTGLARTHAQETAPAMEKLADYVLSTQANSTFTFIDLSSAEEAGEHGIRTMPIGEDLPTGEDLTNRYYGFAMEPNGFTINPSDATDGMAIFPAMMVNESGAYVMEKAFTGFVISATGGIFFDTAAIDLNAETPVLPKLKAPAAGTLPDAFDMPVGIAAYLYQYDNETKKATPIVAKKAEGKAPAYLGIGTDEFGTFIIVQYDYMVNNDNWIYQIIFTGSGKVSCNIKQMPSTVTGGSYRLALGAKREDETLLLGSQINNIYSIDKITDPKTESWGVFSTQMKNRAFTMQPKAGTIAVTPDYTSADATITLTALTQKAASAGTLVICYADRQLTSFTHTTTEAYKAGDKIGAATVIYNDTPGADDITVSLDGLAPGKRYYLYALLGTSGMAEGSWKYATTPIITQDFTTPAVTPPTAIKAGTPDGRQIPFEIEGPAAGMTMMVVKSASAQSIAPKGKLTVGQKYNNMEQDWMTGNMVVKNSGTVLAFLDPGTTSFNVDMTPGEMAYIHVYSVLNPDAATPEYSNNIAMAGAYLQADRLPLSYNFSGNDEAGSRTEGMPLLPPGMTTSAVFNPEDEDAQKIRSSAFIIARVNEKFPLLSLYAYDFENGKPVMDTRWVDVIAPAFSGAKKVTASFFTQFYTSGQLPGQYNTHKPTAGDSARIEYSLNDGPWQTAATFTAGNLPALNENGQYPLAADFTCTATDIVRIRYSYRTATPGVFNAVYGFDILEPRDCETPAQLTAVADGMTDRQIQLRWSDNNVTPAGQYLVAYQKYIKPATDNGGGMGGGPLYLTAEGDTEEAEVWNTISVNTAEAVLPNLEPQTTYSIKVQAVCGALDSSFVSSAIRLSTATGMPYAESMACGEFDWDKFSYAFTPNVSVYAGKLDSILEEGDFMVEGGIPATWNANLSQGTQLNDADPQPDAAAVMTAQKTALLATPAIYIRKAEVFFPKTLTFKLNTYSKIFDEKTYSWAAENGVDLDPEFRLYVLVSTNGQFSWKDTVAAYDHNDLKAAEAEGEAKAEGETAPRGKAFSIDLSQYEGTVQFAFYFHNPNFLDFESPDYNGEEPLYLELFDLAFDYDGTPCFPVEGLSASNIDIAGATLSWTGEGAEYGIAYGPADGEPTETVYQDATDAERQTITLADLTPNTKYKATVISYCTKGDRENGSPARTVEFTTKRQTFHITIDILPNAEAGTVTGDGDWFENDKVTLKATANDGYAFVAWLNGTDTLSKEATYQFTMPAENLAYTALFVKELANETQLKADFNVSTKDGLLHIRNLKGIAVKDINVYGLTGNLVNRFTLNSREDLTLPIDARRALLFVRLNTELGVAVYKVYLQ